MLFVVIIVVLLFVIVVSVLVTKILLFCSRCFVLVVVVLVVCLPKNTPANKQQNNKNRCYIVFLTLSPWQGFAQREADNPKQQQ